MSFGAKGEEARRRVRGRSTGAPALVLLEDAPASVAVLVVGLRVSYTKKLVGDVVAEFEIDWSFKRRNRS